MRKKIWGIIAVIIGLLLIAVIIYFMFFYKFPAPPELVNEQPTSQPQAVITPEPTSTKPPVTIQPVSPLKRTEVKPDDLARMAAAFAERFGSFSNQSDYGNLRDLQIFMTDGLKTWAQNYINEARLKKADTSIYYGIVTKAVLSEVRQFDGDLGQAEILVKTQRRESAGVTGNSSTFYQDIIIKYRREGKVWQVDGVYWQDR